ncbi:alkaline protease [Truncatella angustata]|uniref:Alkaline protease n=1 Tax=Truncatella angustata TaxID=152316 RepID=A0A9P8RIT6_9PEZI|nr:alkaline protease [Truncatella angustata]KAH6646634.1 alkaline protease [Truncatella angustata]
MVNFQQFIIVVAALSPLTSAVPKRQQQKREVIQDRYIVTLKNNISTADVRNHLDWVDSMHSLKFGKRKAAGVDKTYNIQDWNAYAGEFDSDTIEEIKSDAAVASVEEDQVWYIFNGSSKTDHIARALATQTNTTWGLATVSHREPDFTSYVYDSTAGSGTYAYIVDSGILTTHIEFGGRASYGYNAVGGPNVDSYGHGTHVAGIISGATYGVSKLTKDIAVKVFEGESTLVSIILDGYSWAVNDITSKSRQSKSVISISISGRYSAIFNDAIDVAYSSGILTVVAAGNEATDAAIVSPASAPHALTVGALDSNWSEADYSNYGPILDIYAPGTEILSAWIGSDTDTYIDSGTSMATPHVTGLALYLMALEGLSGPDAVIARIKSLATSDMITGLSSGSPNLILCNGQGT